MYQKIFWNEYVLMWICFILLGKWLRDFQEKNWLNHHSQHFLSKFKENLIFSENLVLLWPRFINRLFINLLRSVQGPQRSCKKDLKSEKTQSSLLFFSPGCTMHIQSIILALYLNAAHTQWPFFVWYCPKIIRLIAVHDNSSTSRLVAPLG